MKRRIMLGCIGVLATTGCAGADSTGPSNDPAEALSAAPPGPNAPNAPNGGSPQSPENVPLLEQVAHDSPAGGRGSQPIAPGNSDPSSPACPPEVPAAFTAPICTMTELMSVADQLITHFRGVAQQYHRTTLAIEQDDQTNKGAMASFDRTDDGSRRWTIRVHRGSVPADDVDCAAQTLPLTRDVAEWTMCHELGHFFAGFPFKPLHPREVLDFTGTYPAAEGQADYFATKTCLRTLWHGQPSNALYRNLVAPEARQRATLCDQVWSDKADQDLCYRILVVSEAEMAWLNVEGKLSQPSQDHATTTVTGGYPTSQCRLDSAVAGALCRPPRNDLEVVPGLNLPDLSTFDPKVYSVDAENAAKPWACYDEPGSPPNPGTRPSCWFVPYQDPTPPDIYDCSDYVDGTCSARQENGTWIEEVLQCSAKTGPYPAERCELGCTHDGLGYAKCVEHLISEAGMCVPRADGTVHLAKWVDGPVDIVCPAGCDYDANRRAECTAPAGRR